MSEPPDGIPKHEFAADAPETCKEDALSTLARLVAADMEACNHTIVARMDSEVELIPRLAAHIVAAGGKRLRPLLTLASARLCGYAGDRHVSLPPVSSSSTRRPCCTMMSSMKASCAAA